MPTVLRVGPYRLHFYSADGNEPVHVHIRRDQYECKFWLGPVRLANAGGLDESELHRIAQIVEQHEIMILDAWNEFFQ
ncbi:DUF4160 domain-containing protein [Aeoliella sp. SH292]|uniref:DUF4160 domain-containing protein n=1 Tax=Aeoliella sp. SH292 TaxID=3454464 RepID=UPI003F992BD9